MALTFAQLRDQLKPASFRGVPFLIDPQAGAELAAGRRVQIHEYPQRDRPYIEDLGRGTREIAVGAYVCGDQYLADSQRLIAALEAEGPGTLVHPWLGEMQVSVAALAEVKYDGALRMASFRLRFAESGERIFPATTAVTSAASQRAAQTLLDRAGEWYVATVRFAGTINRVVVAGLALYGRALKILQNPVGFALGWFRAENLQGNLNSLFALFGTPAQIPPNLSGLLVVSPQMQAGAYTGGTTVSPTAAAKAAADAAIIPLMRGQMAMVDHPDLAARPAASAAPVDQRIAVNEAVILGQLRALLLANVVGMSAYLQAAVHDDIVALRGEILAALERELLRLDSLRLAGMDGAQASALEALIAAHNAARAAVHQDLTTRARDSARLLTIEVPGMLPAIAIAYDRYENAARGPEIVARNKIRRPGFVHGVIRVLSR